MKSVAIIIAALSLAACAQTGQTLREDPTSVRFEVTVQENYQATYNKLLATARKCSNLPLYNARSVAVGDLHTDTREAVVSVSMIGIHSEVPYWTADLKADGNTTHVTLMLPNYFKPSAPSVLGWLHGATVC